MVEQHKRSLLLSWPIARRHTRRLQKRLDLQVLAYNMKRVMAILGMKPLMEAIRT